MLLMKTAFTAREREVVLALAKNARLSDRELASRLKTSQPTITRLRSRLMSEKFIDRFVILPNLSKMGLHFWAVTTVKPTSPSAAKKIVQWANDSSSVLFAAEGEGANMHSILLESVHANFSEYGKFSRELKEKHAGNLLDISTFFVDAANISKFFHWHAVLEKPLHALQRSLDEKKPSRSERLRQALSTIPNPLDRISNPLRSKETKSTLEEKERGSSRETDDSTPDGIASDEVEAGEEMKMNETGASKK